MAFNNNIRRSTLDNHQKCTICNFTGTAPGEHLNYVIPIGNYKIPEHYFTSQNQIKPENWIICQPTDCIKAMSYNPDSVVGNIKDDCIDLFDTICQTTKSCKISPRLNSFCNCEQIGNEVFIDDSDCGCINIPNAN
ncbi:MAG: hypothetical protein IPL23_16225 [Saprospiraceae bacterium]|nr:hypothetical protein [Saprospiraceae bacterium]